MTKTQAQAEMIALLNDSLAKLNACKDNSYVLAYDNGLGICFNGSQPIACALWAADAIVTEEQAGRMPEEAWAYTPIVKNGAGVQARLIPRQQAIAREVTNIRDLISKLTV